MTAPIDVPAMATGFTSISSSASATMMWARPRAPPPPSASATDFIGRPPVSLDHLDVLLEPGPRGKAVVAGDHELRPGQRDGVGSLRMMRGDQLKGAWQAGPGQVA